MRYALVFVRRWTVVPVDDEQARSMARRGVHTFDGIRQALGAARTRNRAREKALGPAVIGAGEMNRLAARARVKARDGRMDVRPEGVVKGVDELLADAERREGSE